MWLLYFALCACYIYISASLPRIQYKFFVFFYNDSDKIWKIWALERQHYSSSAKPGGCVSQNRDCKQFATVHKYLSASICPFIKAQEEGNFWSAMFKQLVPEIPTYWKQWNTDLNMHVVKHLNGTKKGKLNSYIDERLVHLAFLLFHALCVAAAASLSHQCAKSPFELIVCLV